MPGAQLARSTPRPLALIRRPRLLSDSGPCYIAAELADGLDEQGIGHACGQPYHPMTQGKIERRVCR
jgi:transposase InsO family protein